MKSESLKNLRTMREVRSSLEVCLRKKTNTLGSLNSDESVKELISEKAPDREELQLVEKEKQRLRSFYKKVNDSQNRLLLLREKLAEKLRRNIALMKVRKELQKEVYQDHPEQRRIVRKKVGSDTNNFEY